MKNFKLGSHWGSVLPFSIQNYVDSPQLLTHFSPFTIMPANSSSCLLTQFIPTSTQPPAHQL